MNKFTKGLAAFGSLNQSAPSYFADDGATGLNLTTEDKASPEYLAGLQSAATPVGIGSTKDEALNNTLSVAQGAGSLVTTALDGISALATGDTWGTDLANKTWDLDDFRTNNAKKTLLRDSYLKLARDQEEHIARVQDENAGMSLGEMNFASMGRAITNDAKDLFTRKSGEGFTQDSARLAGQTIATVLGSKGLGALTKTALRVPGLSALARDGQALAAETGLSGMTPLFALSAAGDFSNAVKEQISKISDDDILESPVGRAAYWEAYHKGASPSDAALIAREAFYRDVIKEKATEFTLGVDLPLAVALDKTLGKYGKGLYAGGAEATQEAIQTAQANLSSREVFKDYTGSLENAPSAGEGVFDAALAGGVGAYGGHATALTGAAGVGTYRFGKKLGEAGAKAYQAGKEAYDKTKSSVKEELMKKAKAKEEKDKLKTAQQATGDVQTQPEGNPTQEAPQAPVEANTASQSTSPEEPFVVEQHEGQNGSQGYTKMSDGKFYDDNGHEIITKKTLEAQGMKNYEVEAYLAKHKPTHIEVPGGRGFIYTDTGREQYNIAPEESEEPMEASQPEAQPTAEELKQNLTNKAKGINQQPAEDTSYLDTLASTAEQETSAYEPSEVEEAPVFEEPKSTPKIETPKVEEPIAQVNAPELPKSNDSPARAKAKQEALKSVLTAEEISAKAKEVGAEISEDEIKRYNKARDSVANLLAPDDVVINTFYPKEIREKYNKNPQSFDNIYKDFIKVAQDKKAPASERLRAEMYLKSFYSELEEAFNSKEQEDEEFTDLFVQNPQAVEALHSIAEYIDSNPKVLAREETLNKYANTLQGLDSNFIENFIKAFDEGKVDKSDLENEILYSENRNLLDRFKSKAPVQTSEGSAVAALNKAIGTARARTKLTDNRSLRGALNLARKVSNAEGKSTKEIDRVFKETMSKETGDITSARGLMSRISRELNKPNPDLSKVREQVAILKNFATSKLSKANAMHSALARAIANKDGYRITPEPYAYEAINPASGKLYQSKLENQKMSTAPMHLVLANLATEEALGVADAYNTFSKAFPELSLGTVSPNFNQANVDTLQRELAKAKSRIEKKLSNTGSNNELHSQSATTKPEPTQMVQATLNKSNQRGNNNEENSRVHEEPSQQHSSVRQGTSSQSMGKPQGTSSQDLGNHARSVGSHEANGQGSLGTNQRNGSRNEEASTASNSSSQRQNQQLVREEGTEVSSKKTLEEGTNNKVPSSKEESETQHKQEEQNYEEDTDVEYKNDYEAEEAYFNSLTPAQRENLSEGLKQADGDTNESTAKEAEEQPSIDLEKDSFEPKVHKNIKEGYDRLFKRDEAAKPLSNFAEAMSSMTNLKALASKLPGSMSKLLDKVNPESIELLYKNYFTQDKIDNFTKVFNEEISKKFNKNAGIQRALTEMQDDDVDISRRNFVGEGYLLPLIQNVEVKEDYDVEVTLDPDFVKNAYLASVLAMIQAEVTSKVDVDKMFTLEGTESDNKLFWQHFTMPAEVRSTSLRSIPLSPMIDKAIDNFMDLTGLSAKSDVSPTEVRQILNQLVGSAFVLTGSRFKSMGQINRFKANGNTVTISTFDPLKGAKNETVEFKDTLQEPVEEVKEQLVYTLKEVNKDDQGNIVKSPMQEAVADARYALSGITAQGRSKIPYLVTEDYGSDKENTLKVPSTITNSGGKPLHEGTKGAIEARQAVEYKVNPLMTNIFKSLGLQNMLKVFGEYLTPEEKKNLNPAYVLAAEGKNANIESAYNNLEMIVDTVDALGGDAGVHFAYQANLNSRLQMVGSGNPQSAKIIREGISAVMTNVDLTNPTKAHHYTLCIAQGLGVKVQNFTLDTKEHKKNVARELLSALEAHADSISMLQERLAEAKDLDSFAFRGEDVQLLQTQLTEGSNSPLEFAVLVEVANLLNTMGVEPAKKGDKKAQRTKYVGLIQSLLNPKESKDKLPSSFASQAYLEMDGVQNGPFNAVASLTTNSDFSDAVSAYNRGGLHIATDGKALTLSDVRTRHVQAKGDPSQARDSYEEATVSETKSQQELSAFAKSDRVNANVKQVRQATEDVIRFLLPDQVEFGKDSTGEVVINNVKRSFMKNPLTVFVYGAGTRKVSDNTITSALKSFYFALANAQRKVNEHGGEVSEWLFFDRYVKMGYSEEQAKKYSKNISKRLAKALSILAEENNQTYAGKYTDFASDLEVPRFKSLRKFNEIVKSNPKDDTTLTLDSLKSNEEIAKDTNFKKGNLVFSGQQLKNIQDNFFNFYGENIMASLESIMPKSTLENIKLANKVASYTNHLSRLGQYYFASQARFVESGRDTWELSKEASNNIAKDLAALNLSFDSGLSNIVLNPDKVKSAETRAPGLAISGYQVALSKPLTGGIGVKMIPSMVQGNGDAYMMHLLAGTRNTTDVFDGLNIGVNDIEALGSAPNRAAGIAALQNPFDQMVDTLSRILKVYADNPVIFEKYHRDWRDLIKIEYDDSASLGDKKKALIKQAELRELFTPDFEKNLLGATKDDDGANQENKDLNKYYRDLQKSRDKKSNNESFEDTDLKDLSYEFAGNRQNVFSYGRTYTHLAIDQAESIARQHQLLMVAGFSVDQMAGASAPHLFENQKKAYAQIRTDARKALEGKSFANDNALQVAYLNEVQKGLSKYEKENGDSIKAKYDKLRDEVDELCERGTKGISEDAKYSFKNLDQALHGINISKNKGISAPIRGLLKNVLSEQKGLGNKTLYFQGSKEEIAHMLREKLGRPEAAKEMQKQMDSRSINGFHMVIDGITYVFVDTSTVTSYEQLGEVIAHEAIHAVTQNMFTDYYSGKEMDPEDVEAIQHIEALARKFYNLEVTHELANDSNFAGAFLNAETLIAPDSTAKEKARAAKEFIAYALSSAKVSSIIHEMKNEKTISQRLKNIVSSLATWFMKLLTRGHVDVDSMSKSELMHLRYDLARLMAYDMGKKPNDRGPDNNGGGHGMSSSDDVLFSENKTLKSDFDRDVGSKTLGEMLAESPFSEALYKALALHKVEREVDSLARRAEKDAKAMSHWEKVDIESHRLASVGEQTGVLKSLEEKQAYIDNFMIFSNHQFPELSKNYLNKLSMALDEVLPVLRTKFTKEQMDFIEGNHSKKFKNAAMVSAMLSSPEVLMELNLLIPEGFQEDTIGETLSAFKDAALGDIHVSKDLTYGDLALMFRDRLKETIEVGMIDKKTEMTVEVPTEDETVWQKLVDEVYNNRFLTRLNNAVVSAKDSFIEDFVEMVPNQLLKFMLTAFHSNTDGLAENIMQWSLRNFENQTVLALIRDLTSRTESNKGVFDLIKAQKYQISTMRQQIKERIVSNLTKVWKEAFYNSAEQREAFAHMTRAFIKTDIGCVSADGKELVDLVANPEKITQKIQELEAELQNTGLDSDVIKYYIEKAKALAEYMGTGKINGFLLRNPLAIVSNLEDMGKPFDQILLDENKELKKQVVLTLDKLISLYSYDSLDKSLKHEMSVLAKNEPQAMKETLETARGMNYEMQNETRYTNLNEFKGYVPRISKNGEKVIVAPADQREYLEQCGYVSKGKVAINPLADSKGVDYEYFYAPLDPAGSWNTQILQTPAWTRRGVDLRSGKSVTGSTLFLKRDLNFEKEHSKEEHNFDDLIPVFDNRGRLKGWEAVLDPEVLGAVTLNESISEVIGSVRSRIYEETQARSFNELAIGVIADMYEKDTAEDKDTVYVDIFNDDEVKKLPKHVQEAVDINRPQINRWLEKHERDKKFYIRKDLFDDVLGYRSASVGDLWTGKSELPVPIKNGIKAVFDSIFGKSALKVALYGERGTQMVVGELKSIIVVKSGIVPMINLASNVLQLTSRGVPIAKSVKYIRHAWKELEQYYKYYDRKVTLATQGDFTPEKRAEILRLNERITSLSIYPLIGQGELGTIANLGDSNENLEIFKGNFGEKLTDLVEKLPKGAQTMARYAYLSKDTELYKFLEKMSQWGDVVSKYALTEYLKETGMNEQDALDQAKQEYAHYDAATGRVRGYAESTGMFWFGNFMLRSAKIGHNMITKNPVQSLVAAALPFPDVTGTPITDNVLAKALKGTLDYSIGPGMATRGISLNPWVNGVFD